MNDASGLRLWSMRATFVAVAFVVLLFNLLPLQTLPRGWAGPDLLICFALAWSLRRPEFVPLWMLAGLFFVADLLLSRPPGLEAAFAVLACFDAQSRTRRAQTEGFAAEWVRVAVLIVGVIVLSRLILMVVLIPPPPLALTTFQAAATVLVYPLVVAASAVFFGVRQSAPGDLDGYGQRA